MNFISGFFFFFNRNGIVKALFQNTIAILYPYSLYLKSVYDYTLKIASCVARRLGVKMKTLVSHPSTRIVMFFFFFLNLRG